MGCKISDFPQLILLPEGVFFIALSLVNKDLFSFKKNAITLSKLEILKPKSDLIMNGSYNISGRSAASGIICYSYMNQ